MPRMCAIGNQQDTSIVAGAPTSTMLGGGGAAIGGSGTGARRVAGGASRSTLLAGGLTPAPAVRPKPGGPRPDLL